MIDELLRRHPIVTDQIRADELRVLLTELDAVLRSGVGGEVVELGCYKGTAALFMERVLQARSATRTIWLYDSFAGLPEKGAFDQSPAGMQFVAGELLASKRDVIAHFKKAGLRLPTIRKAWFSDLQASDVPDRIAFAFLDGDYYESIRDSLRVIWPRLAPGATVVVDDYASEALPGAARAVDEWVARHPVASIRTAHSLAVIKTLA